MLFTVSFMLVGAGFTQQDWQLVDSIVLDKAEVIEAHIDPLGSLYMVTSSGIISKYNQSGVEQFRFTDQKYGEPTWIDVNDPFSILVAYVDFGIIIELDNRLSEVRIISLPEYGLTTVRHSCRALDGNLWVYDDIQEVIKKIDRNTGRVLAQSGILYDLTEGASEPVKMRATRSGLLILMSDRQLYMMDPFAQGAAPFTRVDEGVHFFVNQRAPFLLRGSMMTTVRPGLRTWNTVQLPQAATWSAQFKSYLWLLSTSGKLYQYKLK